MRAAVTSSDGKCIDLHFGKAGRLLVYEIMEGKTRYIREVSIPMYCDWAEKIESADEAQFESLVSQLNDCAQGSTKQAHNHDRLISAADNISDCSVVVTAMIGDTPKEMLENKGFDIFVTSGDIEDTLKEISRIY